MRLHFRLRKHCILTLLQPDLTTTYVHYFRFQVYSIKSFVQGSIISRNIIFGNLRHICLFRKYRYLHLHKDGIKTRVLAKDFVRILWLPIWVYIRIWAFRLLLAVCIRASWWGHRISHNVIKSLQSIDSQFIQR